MTEWFIRAVTVLLRHPSNRHIPVLKAKRMGLSKWKETRYPAARAGLVDILVIAIDSMIFIIAPTLRPKVYQASLL